jgi:putative transposase
MQNVTVSGYEQANELPEIKASIPEFKNVGSQVLQNVIERLSSGMQAFFRRIKKGGEKAGFPRFKSWKRYDSFTLKNTGWKLKGRYLWVNNIGRFKMNLSREIQGTIKTITVHKSQTNKWYACFSCDEVPENILPQSDKVVGIDVGIKSFLTDSDGSHIENPKYLKHQLSVLRIKQRKLSRAVKGSNRRKETKLQVSKVYEKITNARRDFHFKLANQYVKNYGTIVVENLQIKNMVQNHKLARDINDCAWGKFFEILTFKAEEAGRLVLKENPRNTSKKCSECGAINKELKLSDRIWVCQSCGSLHDRDENASKNIKRLGQSHQTLTCSTS